MYVLYCDSYYTLIGYQETGRTRGGGCGGGETYYITGDIGE